MILFLTSASQPIWKISKANYDLHIQSLVNDCMLKCNKSNHWCATWSITKKTCNCSCSVRNATDEITGVRGWPPGLIRLRLSNVTQLSNEGRARDVSISASGPMVFATEKRSMFSGRVGKYFYVDSLSKAVTISINTTKSTAFAE